MELQKRKIIRLPQYDYSQNGAYFITICLYDKTPLFGKIVHGQLQHTALGRAAVEEIARTNVLRRDHGIEITKYVVMPNHVHMLIEIVGSRRAVTGAQIELFGAPTKNSVPTVVRAYKSAVTKRAHSLGLGNFAWQRRYHDHVVRNEREYLQIWQYIDSNAQKWGEDCYFLGGHGTP